MSNQEVGTASDGFNHLCQRLILRTKNVDRLFPATVIVDDTDKLAALRVETVKAAISEDGAVLEKEQAGNGKTVFHLQASVRQLALIELRDLFATSTGSNLMQATKTVVRLKQPVRALASALVK